MSNPWTVAFLEADRVVAVTTSGTMSVAMMDAMCYEALAFGEARGTNRYLFDHRAMVPEVSVVKIYRSPDALRRLGVSPDVHAATVYSVESCRREDFQFFGTVASNRGLPYRMFTDYDAALEWLRSRPPSERHAR